MEVKLATQIPYAESGAGGRPRRLAARKAPEKKHWHALCRRHGLWSGGVAPLGWSGITGVGPETKNRRCAARRRPQLLHPPRTGALAQSQRLTGITSGIWLQLLRAALRWLTMSRELLRDSGEQRRGGGAGEAGAGRRGARCAADEVRMDPRAIERGTHMVAARDAHRVSGMSGASGTSAGSGLAAWLLELMDRDDVHGVLMS